MDNVRLFLGVDGGGTKTVGILTAEDGRELASVRVGPTNPNVVGVAGTAGQLIGLIQQCCSAAQVAPESIKGGVFGLAGAGAATLKEQLLAALTSEAQKRGLTLPILKIETDARISLEGAFSGGPGVIVIAGTGSAVLGKSPEGEIRLVGGWGRTLGDEGSGYSIGLDALRAVTRMIDGRDESTPLRDKLDKEFGFNSRQKVVQGIYQEGFSIPTLAPTVIAAAEEGDPVAMEILRKGFKFLSEQVGVLVNSYHSIPEVGVVFIGGLIDHEGLPARLLSEALRTSAPVARVRAPMEPPVAGAVRLARQLSST